VLCCYFSIQFALFYNDIRASCNICNRICHVAPVCTLVWYMVPWVSRVYTQRHLHHFVMVQLFYNSCKQIIHRIRQVAPLCTAMWRISWRKVLINNVNEITNYLHHVAVHSGATWRIQWIMCAAVVKQLNHRKVMQTPLGVDSWDPRPKRAYWRHLANTIAYVTWGPNVVMD